ncbi:hypothetical protein [Massilia varians]|uniref:hypothetical protein n=1 Tax=Massilia varians TaxID=457921 RepID=UPI00255747B6|nr:hypothetical protein [Massilia varians]
MQLAAGDGARHPGSVGRFAAELGQQAAHQQQRHQHAQDHGQHAQAGDPVARARSLGLGKLDGLGGTRLQSLEQHVDVGHDAPAQRAAFLDQEAAEAFQVAARPIGARPFQLACHGQHALAHLAVLGVVAQDRVEAGEGSQVLGLARVDQVELAPGCGFVLEDVGVARRDAGLGQCFARGIQGFEFAVPDRVKAVQCTFDAVHARHRERRENERKRQNQGKRRA